MLRSLFPRHHEYFFSYQNNLHLDAYIELLPSLFCGILNYLWAQIHEGVETAERSQTDLYNLRFNTTDCEQSKNIVLSLNYWFTWDKWSKILAWAISIAAGASTSDINSQHADTVLFLAAVSQSCGFAWFGSSDYLHVVQWGRTRIHRLCCAFWM